MNSVHKSLRGIDGGRAPQDISVDPDDAESAYPLSEFTLPAQDSHGHTARIITRVPPNMKHQIQVLISKKLYPWETEADFTRWAVYEGLKKVTEHAKDPEVTSLFSLVETWVASARVQQEHLKLGQSLEHISATVSELMNKGAAPAARKIVKDISENIHRIDDPFWRRKYEEDISQRFAFLFEADRPAPVRRKLKKRSKK